MNGIKKRKTKFYRAMEILPGLLTWTTLIGAVVFSYILPFWVAVFIILFDLYWVLKALNHSMHLLSSFSRLKQHGKYDWQSRLASLGDIEGLRRDLARRQSAAKAMREKRDLTREIGRLNKPYLRGRDLDFRRVYHVVLLPTLGESVDVLDQSIRSVLDSEFPAKQIIFLLATEERDYQSALKNGTLLRERFGDKFFRFEVVMHPDGILGEIKAKGANITYAAKRAAEIVRAEGIPIENVLVSALDSDTVVSPNYLSYLTYMFLTVEKPYLTSYQPMPVYNNNIWDAPAATRVVAVANSFWQMVEASRPDRLVTFSSHAMTLKALIEVDYWPVDVVSDDSRIFWRCWLYYNGDYRTQPLFTTVSLDTMLDKTYWKTMLGQYKQKRRWASGVENFPYLVEGAARNKAIPVWKKFLYIERMLEGFYFWATASIMIAILGWLPLFLGGSRFDDQVIAVNLPVMTRTIMQIATLFLIFSVYINLVLLPPRPKRYSKWRSLSMILQWVFIPIVSTLFGSIPAIDAQTRIMFGKYLGFWVAPKARFSKNESAPVYLKKNEERGST